MFFSPVCPWYCCFGQLDYHYLAVHRGLIFKRNSVCDVVKKMSLQYIRIFILFYFLLSMVLGFFCLFVSSTVIVVLSFSTWIENDCHFCLLLQCIFCIAPCSIRLLGDVSPVAICLNSKKAILFVVRQGWVRYFFCVFVFVRKKKGEMGDNHWTLATEWFYLKLVSFFFFEGSRSFVVFFLSFAW